MKEMKKNWRGILVCLLIAIPSWFLGKRFEIVGGAVIAILAGMLLPALQKARERGKSASCTNMMKQIGLASNQYIEDFHGYLPQTETPWSGECPNWTLQVLLYFPAARKAEFNYDIQWLKQKKIFVCPSEVKIDAKWGVTNYAWNLWAGGKIISGQHHFVKIF